MGPTDRRDPCDRDTKDRGELGHRRSQRRRGLLVNRGHHRVPHFEADLLTYLARALLAPRVLAVGYCGAAVLRGDTPVNWGHGDSVEV